MCVRIVCGCESICVCLCVCTQTVFRRMVSSAQQYLESGDESRENSRGLEGACIPDFKFHPCVFNTFISYIKYTLTCDK
jgi:hypothetical protein